MQEITYQLYLEWELYPSQILDILPSTREEEETEALKDKSWRIWSSDGQYEETLPCRVRAAPRLHSLWVDIIQIIPGDMVRYPVSYLPPSWKCFFKLNNLKWKFLEVKKKTNKLYKYIIYYICPLTRLTHLKLKGRVFTSPPVDFIHRIKSIDK